MICCLQFLLLVPHLLEVGCSCVLNGLIPPKNAFRTLFVRTPELKWRNVRGSGRIKSESWSSEPERTTSETLDYEEMTKKIKMLRSTTGRGTQECFKALNKAMGDVRMASQILLNALMEKKRDEGGTDVVTSLEGTIAISCSPEACSIIDLRCDTDFVGKNKLFTGLAKSFANASLEYRLRDPESSKSPEEMKSQILNSKCLRCGQSLLETGTMVRGALRESVSVARIAFIQSDPNEFFVFYVHSTLDPKNSPSFAGPAASILSFELKDTSPDSFYHFYDEQLQPSHNNCCMSGTPCVYSKVRSITDFHNEPELDETRKFLRELAIHVVAEKPKELGIEQFDPSGLEETKKEVESLLSQGKPADLVDKIVKGRLRKKYGQSVLMEQIFTFGNGSNSVSQVIQNSCKSLNKDIKLKKFITYAVSDDLINFRHPQNLTFYNTNIKF